MKNRALTLEQMQHLGELGVDISSNPDYMNYYYDPFDNPVLVYKGTGEGLCRAFTLQDMLEMISSLYPTRINGERKLVHTRQVDSECTYMPSIYLFDDYWHACYIDNDSFVEIDFLDDNATNACYKLLCWLAENKLLRKEE